jgi:hypothetical protein
MEHVDNAKWRTIQERSIALTGKTIEDLSPEEAAQFVNALTNDDRLMSLEYLLRRDQRIRIAETGREEGIQMKPRKQPVKPPAPQKFTLAQAFDYYYGVGSSEQCDYLNDERSIRAAAFLLTYCSQHGNEMIDGNAANGLARILEHCASRMAMDHRGIARRIEEARRG